MFCKVLVANRGEIAVRLLRTLRDMGICGVAVFSRDEADALHPRLADEAYVLEADSPIAGYLDSSQLLSIARQAGADALLPGYGFLSENPELALACEAENVCFVGPPASAISDMGDKLRARELMQRAGVPVVPGGPAPDLATARQLANGLGFPLLVKASMGGGGKGMRRVNKLEALEAAFHSAQREAERAFGANTVYIEKALVDVRHVEIQILGDQHGNCVHLYERDCSIQRRHQKVVEETPCPSLSSDTMGRMTQAAIAGARAVGYHSVGTFEFLLEASGDFYFIEMNTRLQVEHTVTEMVTGLDLVREMLRVAAGETLGFEQDQVQRRGAALQCRVYAENPDTGFLPSTGKITHLQPPEGPFLRHDSALRPGLTVSPDFDPLLSKLCAWGSDRSVALARMRRGLAEFSIGGVISNLGFHRRLMDHPDFVAGRYTTDFLDQHPQLLGSAVPSEGQMVGAVSAARLHSQNAESRLVVQPATAWARSSCDRHPHRA
jgi:acetyl-CoA carboxylase, biotin carboxylase subunit